MNHIADIAGTAADSFCHFKTNRVVDPLRPEYTWPGLSADIGRAAYCPTPERVPTPKLTSTPGGAATLASDPGRVAATPPPPSPKKDLAQLEESLRQVKDVFHKRGAYAGRALARVVRNFDD